MGMVNQLGKFLPTYQWKPLRELLSSKCAWVWGPGQEQLFSQVKAELTQPTVLMLCDPKAETKVSVDASSSRLGAVLLQRANKPMTTGGLWPMLPDL